MLKYFLFLIFFSLSVFSQTNLTGYVKSLQTNEPLVSANVLIEGTNLGAPTNKNGYFEISGNISGSDIILVSYIGFENVRISVEEFKKKRNKKHRTRDIRYSPIPS